MDNQVVVVAAAVNAEGRCETLGLAVSQAKTKAFRAELSHSMMRRGLAEIWLMISDAHEGLEQASPR